MARSSPWRPRLLALALTVLANPAALRADTPPETSSASSPAITAAPSPAWCQCQDQDQDQSTATDGAQTTQRQRPESAAWQTRLEAQQAICRQQQGVKPTEQRRGQGARIDACRCPCLDEGKAVKSGPWGDRNKPASRGAPRRDTLPQQEPQENLQ